MDTPTARGGFAARLRARAWLFAAVLLVVVAAALSREHRDDARELARHLLRNVVRHLF